MNSKFSIARRVALAAALAAGASGMARADDNSMNPFTGESYAYFNVQPYWLPAPVSRGTGGR